MTPIEDCMARRETYRIAARTVETLIEALGKIYGALARQVGRGGMQSWQTITISPGGPYPSDAIGGEIILADGWPTAQQFNLALSQWHFTRFEYSQAWVRVPFDQKKQYQELRPEWVVD
jgi:hypothetical protein